MDPLGTEKQTRKVNVHCFTEKRPIRQTLGIFPPLCDARSPGLLRLDSVGVKSTLIGRHLVKLWKTFFAYIS